MLRSGSLSGLSQAVKTQAIAKSQLNVALTRAGGQTPQAKQLEVLPPLLRPVYLIASEEDSNFFLASEEADAYTIRAKTTAPTSK